MRNLCKAALCLILVIFFIPLYGAAQTGPTLVIPTQVPTDVNGPVTVPVTYIANGNLISSMIFSVDYDENNLIFDPTITIFPWPDAITINPLISPFVFSVGITYDANDTDGELDFTFSDINLPLSALPEGELVTITFTAGNPAADTDAPVRFSLDPTASFGNTDGASVPGVTLDGSVFIDVECLPTDTVDTTCDGIDDDCDGLIDEDYVPRPVICDPDPCITETETCQCVNGVEECPICIPAPPVPEVCDNLDNDCDGLIDEDLTRPTICGVGECGATGEETCSSGMWGNDTCTPGTPSAEVCDNLDNDCDSSIDEDFPSLGMMCTVGVGACENTGTYICTADGTGTECNAVPGTPSTEVCDNLDNDCDGATDENLTRPTTCGVGECVGNTGVEECQSGTVVDTCDPFAGAMPEGPPGDPTCGDTLDNDCDGLTDLADPGCDDCTPTDEICDNIDNDCDGAVDENLTRPTTCGVGECAGNTGEETCSAGAWGGDTCDPLEGAVLEVCDCLDNDCDGVVDGGGCACICGETRSCGSDVGECLTGTETCIDAQWSGVCLGEVGPTEEVCDNLDNDCDGMIDEDLTRPTICGVGVCEALGQETCTTGTWGNNTCIPGTPSPEICDDVLDNDCDGMTDSNDPDCNASGETDCSDGIDNDGDSLTDCADPDCEGVAGGICSTGNACTTGTNTCQGGAEVCVPVNVPDGTACDDGLFCTVVDTCNGSGACTGESSPCQPGDICDEANDVCVPLCGCVSDADCDDGLFCNGFEICDGCWCNAGPNPCQPGEVCDENQDTCSEPLDLDIVKFTVSGSKDKRNTGKTKTGGSANVGKPIRRIQLVVENPNGGIDQVASATITGVQDGKEIYSETRMVWDLGTGKARFAFPNYTPVKKGTIQWTAEVFDNDPDNDTATATTRVK